jgi:hypothetical protein
LSLLLFACFIILTFLNLANIYSLAAILIIALGYLFLRKHLELVLCLVIPALAFGQVLKFPIGWQWEYEASIAEILLIFIFIIFFLDKFINKKIGEIKVDLIMILLSAYLLASLFSFWQAIDLRLFIFGLKVLVFSFLAYFLFYNLTPLDPPYQGGTNPPNPPYQGGTNPPNPPYQGGDNPPSPPYQGGDNPLNPVRLNSQQSTLYQGRGKRKANLFLSSLLIIVLILSAEIFIKFYEMGWSTKILFDRSNIIINFGPLATASAALAFLLPIILAHYFSTPSASKAKPFIFITFVLGSLAVFLTLGKAAILSFVVGLFYFFMKFKSKRKIFIISLIIFTVLSAIIFSSFASGLIKRTSTTFIDINSKFRVLEYKVGWELIKDNFLFGVGAGQQLLYFKKILDYETANLVNNFFLQALIDYGLIGFSLVVLIIISLFKKIFNLARRIAADRSDKILFYGFTAALIVSFISGLLEVTFFTLSYAIIFWSVLGIFGNLENYKSDNLINLS